MKAVLRNISILIYIAYIAGFAYILLQITGKTKHVLYLSSISPFLLYAIVGTFILGTIGAILLLLNSQTNVKIVVEDTTLSHKNTDKQNSKGSNQEQGSSSSVNKSFIIELEKVIISNQNNRKVLLETFLQKFSNHLEISIAAIYLSKLDEEHQNRKMSMVASFGYYGTQNEEDLSFEFGEGLVGQVAKSGKVIQVEHIPEDYFNIASGLGSASPRSLIFVPIKNEEEEVLGVIESASFKDLDKDYNYLFEEVASLLAREIEANEYEDVQ